MILKEPIKRRHLAALSLEILGTLAIIIPMHIKLNMVGVGLALCSTVLFSIYGVMGKRKCAEYGGAVVTCFSFLFGSVIIFCFITITWSAVWDSSSPSVCPPLPRSPSPRAHASPEPAQFLCLSAAAPWRGFCAYFLAMGIQRRSAWSRYVFLQNSALAHTVGLDGPRRDPGNMLMGIPH